MFYYASKNVIYKNERYESKSGRGHVYLVKKSKIDPRKTGFNSKKVYAGADFWNVVQKRNWLKKATKQLVLIID